MFFNRKDTKSPTSHHIPAAKSYVSFWCLVVFGCWLLVVGVWLLVFRGRHNAAHPHSAGYEHDISRAYQK